MASITKTMGSVNHIPNQQTKKWLTQSNWSLKPIVKLTAKTSLSKLMLAVKGLTMLKLLSI